MKICPRCHAVGNDPDNFCGKCGYIYNQEIALKRNIDEDFYKTVKKSRKYIFWFKFLYISVLLLFFILFCSLVSTEPWFSISFALVMIVGLTAIISFSGNTAHLHEKFRKYKQGKNFKLYRKSTDERKQPYKRVRNFLWILTVTSVVYLILSLILRLDRSDLWAQILFALIAIVLSFCIGQSYQLKFLQEKYHQAIDDATYFELEELGMVKETDVVISLYKDFPSWKNIKENNKILILTQDTLVCLVFSDRTHARKISIPLSSIDELGFFKSVVFISKFKGNLNGLIFTIGRQKQYVRIVLNGLTILDSPEEFVSRFLKQLDNVILSRPSDEVKTYKRTESTTSENLEQIRQIEIADVSKITSSELETATLGTVNQPSRTIDL